MPSEWSVTTRKSSGRESLTGWPVLDETSSPPREAIGVTGREPRAEGTRVHRIAGVQVRVAEQRPRGKVPARVRRVGRFRRVDLLQVRSGRCANVTLCDTLIGGQRLQCETGDRCGRKNHDAAP